jgi:hypothetical protein
LKKLDDLALDLVGRTMRATLRWNLIGKGTRRKAREDYSTQCADPDDRAMRRASRAKGQPITSFARQKRKEFVAD